MFTFYFKGTYIKGGPSDGSDPKPIPSPIEKAESKFYELTLKLKQELLRNEYKDPKGDWKIGDKNGKQLKELLKPFLISGA